MAHDKTDTIELEPLDVTLPGSDEELTAELLKLHNDILVTQRKTQADAVVAGRILEAMYGRLGKGRYGAWRLGIKLPESTAHRYRCVFRRWHRAQAMGMPTSPQRAATGETVPIPKAWKGKTLKQLAHQPQEKKPKDPETPEQKAAAAYTEWVGAAADVVPAPSMPSPRLDPVQFRAAIRTVAAVEEKKAVDFAERLTAMLCDVLPFLVNADRTKDAERLAATAAEKMRDVVIQEGKRKAREPAERPPWVAVATSKSPPDADFIDFVEASQAATSVGICLIDVPTREEAETAFLQAGIEFDNENCDLVVVSLARWLREGNHKITPSAYVRLGKGKRLPWLTEMKLSPGEDDASK